MELTHWMIVSLALAIGAEHEQRTGHRPCNSESRERLSMRGPCEVCENLVLLWREFDLQPDSNEVDEFVGTDEPKPQLAE